MAAPKTSAAARKPRRKDKWLFTARDQAQIEEPTKNPDVQIEVIGKRWAWDFNYLTDNAYSTGVQADFNPDGSINANNLFDTLGMIEVTQPSVPGNGVGVGRASNGRTVSASLRLDF